MKNLKRVLSMALATAMVLGMMVVGSGAVSADVTGDHNQEAIAKVNVLGIMVGDEDGNFNPDNTVTRNEMAVVMANLSGVKLNGAHPFTDVPNWADKYVGAIYSNGLTSGTSATTYGGAANVTTAEAALMIMKTLGYFEYQGEFKDDWKLETVKRATQIELFEDVDAGVDEALTRNELAQMIDNALYTRTVIVEETAGMTVEGNGITVSQNASYNYDNKGAILLDKLFDGVLSSNLDKDGNTTDKDNFGRNSITWTYSEKGEDDVEATYVEAADYVLIADETESITDMIKEEKLTKKIEKYEDWDNVDFDRGTVIELFLNDDDEIAYYVDYTYVAVEIDDVVECDEDISAEADAMEYDAEYVVSFKSNDYVDVEMFDTQLEGFDAKTYVEGAYVIFPVVDGVAVVDADAVDVSDKDVEDLYVGTSVAEIVTGEVETWKNTSANIDGEKYTYSQYFDDKDQIVPGKETNVVLDPNGFALVAWLTEDDKSIEDVYVVDASYEEEDKWGNKSYFVQLIDLNGEVTEVELEYAHGTRGDLVTIADEKVKNSDGTTKFKANNDKYIMTDWVDAKTGLDVDGNYATASINLNSTDKNGVKYTAIEKNDNRIAADGTKRLNADTQYVLVSETKGDLEVVVKTGGVNLTITEKMTNIVITEKDENEVLYVIVLSDAEIDEDTVLTDDMIYISKVSISTGDGYVTNKVVFANGDVKTIKIDEYSTVAVGWFEYAINEDGYYELTPVDESDYVTATGVWDEQEGVIENGVIANADALYGTLLTVGELEDIEVADAKFVDLNNGDYESDITKLSRLIDLLDKKAISNVEVAMYITEDGASLIVLTNAD